MRGKSKEGYYLPWVRGEHLGSRSSKKKIDYPLAQAHQNPALSKLPRNAGLHLSFYKRNIPTS
jgi:hypothetical protein